VPWGALHSSMLSSLHYPTLTSGRSMYDLRSLSTQLVHVKFETDSIDSPAQQLGVTIADLRPERRAIEDIGNLPVRPHKVEYFTAIWRGCSARVGLLWGKAPRRSYTRELKKRIALVKRIRIPTSPGRNAATVRVYLEHDSAADKTVKRVSRIVMGFPHSEFWNRFRALDLTPAYHALMAVERFIDIATLIAFRQVRRPCLLGSVTCLTQRDLVFPTFHDQYHKRAP
jgi:hypothetical protein